MSTKPAVNQAVVIAFRDAAEFEAWLDAHVDLRAGVWLKLAKKRSGAPSLTDNEAVDSACATAGSPASKAYDVPVAISSEPDAAQARAGRSGDLRGRGIQS